MKLITIEQAITACDELKPNSYTTEQKKKWHFERSSENDNIFKTIMVLVYRISPPVVWSNRRNIYDDSRKAGEARRIGRRNHERNSTNSSRTDGRNLRSTLQI